MFLFGVAIHQDVINNGDDTFKPLVCFINSPLELIRCRHRGSNFNLYLSRMVFNVVNMDDPELYSLLLLDIIVHVAAWRFIHCERWYLVFHVGRRFDGSSKCCVRCIHLTPLWTTTDTNVTSTSNNRVFHSIGYSFSHTFGEFVPKTIVSLIIHHSLLQVIFSVHFLVKLYIMQK